MTKEETKSLIEVMHGHIDGKQIQCSAIGIHDWTDICADNVSGPVWNFQRYNYRIKPEPRVIEAKEDESIELYNKIGSNMRTVRGPCKFIEVIDD